MKCLLPCVLILMAGWSLARSGQGIQESAEASGWGQLTEVQEEAICPAGNPGFIAIGPWCVVQGPLPSQVDTNPKVGEASGHVERPNYEQMICSYQWDCARAIRIMYCESSGNPRAYAAGNLGLFQLNMVHAAMVGGNPEAFYDPATNIRIAYALYQASGWRPWVVCGA